jgi:cytochrome c oxidase subunit 1/cytochrome c oxidase subunit I+III
MPRRIYTYPSEMGWTFLNQVTTVGAFLFALGVLLLIVNVVVSLRRGAFAGANPWDSYSLEWAIPSPPPSYDFAVIPTVSSRYPLWEGRLRNDETLSSAEDGPSLEHEKEMLLTSSLDADPTLIVKMPEDTLTPFVLSLGLTVGFVGLLLRLWPLAGAGAAICILSLIVWVWPRRKLAQVAEARL